MAQYGQFQYGRFERYGKYTLSTDIEMAGNNQRFRIRTIDKKGRKGSWVSNHKEKIESNNIRKKIRLRSNKSSWIYAQSIEMDRPVGAVRIRSIKKDKQIDPWIYANKGTLMKEGD